jgi:glycosyltransferase involved in cell wall biosynthesis
MNVPILSIVIPCYNEETCLNELYDRVSVAAQQAVSENYEIVLVNDGSSDASWAAMCRLHDIDARVIAINLSRNHGHQMALTAGLDLCRGTEILIIDADLQDPPELLSEMRYAMHAHGADVIYAVRRTRAGEGIFKRATAIGFYRLLTRLTDTAIPEDTGDFRLMSRRALLAFLAMPEQARFVRGMVAWIGFKQVPFPYDRQERFAGSTKYPIAKMMKLAFDAVTGFSTAPLRLASHLGLILTIACLLFILYIVIAWFNGSTVDGWASTTVIILALGAVQMFVLGMIGEYLGRLYLQSKGRPLYLVSDVLGDVRNGELLGFYSEGAGRSDNCDLGEASVASETPIGS